MRTFLRRYALALIGLLGIAICVLLMGGCGGSRAPATKKEAARVQNVANAAAGLDALVLLGLDPVTAEIVKGARAYVRAAAENIQVPPPTMAPETIAAKPKEYRAAGEKAQREAAGTQFAYWLKSAALLAVPILIALAKNLGPLGKLSGGLASAAWTIFAPAATKDAEESRNTLAAGIHTVVGLVPPGTLARLPDEFHEALATMGPPPIQPPTAAALAASMSVSSAQPIVAPEPPRPGA